MMTQKMVHNNNRNQRKTIGEANNLMTVHNNPLEWQVIKISLPMEYIFVETENFAAAIEALTLCSIELDF